MSLKTKSVLVSLGLTQWTARKLDREASNELCATKGAAQGAGRFNKVLIRPEHLKPIQRMVNSIRNYHYANTLAWEHKGADILPSGMYLEYRKEMNNFETKFNALVREFITDYPIMKQQVEQRLGELYNEDDYPSPEAVASKFSMHIDITPVPDTADFRVDLDDQEVQEMKDSLAARLEVANLAAEHELFARLYTTIAKTVVTLRDPNKIFRNTLILNALELSRKAPKLNVNNNEKINDIAVDILNLSKRTDIASLRDVDELDYRMDTADKYEDLLTRIETAYEESRV